MVSLVMTKVGPNDVSGVVWALGKFFFLVFFYLTN